MSDALQMMMTGSRNSRVLVVGDTHGDFRWMRDVVIPTARANGCARIMQVGDFGFVWTNDDDSDYDLDRLNEILVHVKVTLAFLPGNHENHRYLATLAGRSEQNEDGHFVLRRNIFYTGRVSAWEWSGVRMAAVGGGVSIDRELRTRGETWWPEEVLSADEIDYACNLGPVDLLFSHDAPDNIPLSDGGLIPHLGSAFNRLTMSKIALSLRPVFWFHGHYHRSLLYQFPLRSGMCQVRGLDCQPNATSPANYHKGDSLHVVDLRVIAMMAGKR